MFAKVFSQIYDSSIVESPETRFTFMDFLVLSDMNGVVDMTHEAISRRTNRPIELIRSTIAELEKPDERSRTPDFKGARLIRLDDHRDWGWMIVNYKQFRDIANSEQKRAKTLARVHKHRGINDRNALKRSVTPSNASNAMQKQREEVEGDAKESQMLIEAWNKTNSIPAARITEKRRKSINARLGDSYFRDNFETAISKIAASDFCAGKNDRGWRPDIDWFLRPDSIVRTMEGKYDNRDKPKANTSCL